MTEEEKQQRLRQLDSSIAGYEELLCDIDDPEYVARGNGFCDSKYSEDFILGQIEKLNKEKEELTKQKTQ